MVHCCYVHVCFIQVTTCGAPDALTGLGARIFLLLSHLLGSQNKYQKESARTEARQRLGSAKQVSKLSLGQNKHGQNITTPFRHFRFRCSEMFYFAQKAVLHPSAPLWNYAGKDLTEACKRALTLIFKICDMDNDGAMSDTGTRIVFCRRHSFLLLSIGASIFTSFCI